MKKLLTALVLLPGLAAARSPLRLEPRHPAARDLIWTDGVMQLKRPHPASAPKLGYAVLKARPDPGLERLLPQGYALAPLPQSFDLNYYVVPVHSAEQLPTLAAWAHESTGFCGSLEFVRAQDGLASSRSIYAPIYGGRAVFAEVKTLIDTVSLPAMDQTIDTLTALPSRHFRHPQGEFAHNTVRQIWEAQILTPRWTISEEPQGLSNQMSLVARLEGLSRPEETIIIGAHLDSIVSRGSASDAPGADDDASGVAAVTEVLRLIEANQLNFDRSIELHAYAAEEAGLIGSKAIAARYAAAGKKVAGMLQIDMAYYSVPGASGVIHLLQDYTSRDLRRQAIEWMRGYMGPVYKLGFLPRGSSSDHKAFYDQGFPTLFPFEDPKAHNPYIHSLNDTRAQFDDGLLLRRITQLALLFAVHQGGLQSVAGAYEALKMNLLPEEKRQGITLAIQNIEGQMFVTVSAPLETATLEFCPIDAGTNPHCLEERAVLDAETSSATRKFFYSTAAVNWAADQKWRVLAYDAHDELIAWRHFTLKAP
jgi:hypothetical protein